MAEIVVGLVFLSLAVVSFVATIVATCSLVMIARRMRYFEMAAVQLRRAADSLEDIFKLAAFDQRRDLSDLKLLRESYEALIRLYQNQDTAAVK